MRTSNTFTLYTNLDIQGEEVKAYDYSICEVNTMEIHTYKTIEELVGFLKSVKESDITLQTYRLEISGLLILNYFNSIGFEYVEKNPKSNQYSFFLTPKSVYTIDVKVPRKTFRFKNINNIIGLRINDYSSSFDIDDDTNDAYKLAIGIKYYTNKGVKLCNTIGATALNDFKTLFRKPNEHTRTIERWETCYPILDKEVDKAIRPAYRGGYCWLNPKYKNVVLNNVRTLDVNTYYGSITCEYGLPMGKPKKVEPNLELYADKLFVVHIFVGGLTVKENHLPCISYINKNHSFWITNDDSVRELTLTNYDFQLLKEHYTYDYLEIADMWLFRRGTTEYFNQYYSKWYGAKLEATKTNNKGLRQVSKSMCNNLTGKFGTKIESEVIVNYEKTTNEVNGIYLPVSMFITSIARHNLVKTAQKFYEKGILVYCDTDSIHFIDDGIDTSSLNIDIDNLRLGAYKDEGICDRAYYICQKTYIHETNGKCELRVAGLPTDINYDIKFEEFKVGYTFRTKEFSRNLKELSVKYVEKLFTIGEL